jgi:hypothetical protein
MKDKIKNLNKLWLDDASSELRAELFNYNDFDSLDKFTGTHPSVMQKRINEQNWSINLDPSQKKMSLKKRLLYWFEKKTGVRLFEYKNYKII